jgi:NADH-quinone oxidoreductase subunit N
MNSFDYGELLFRLLPHTVLVAGALLVLFWDQASAARLSLAARSGRAVSIALLVVFVSIVVLNRQSEVISAYNGMLQFADFERVIQTCLLILAAGTLLIALPHKFTTHIGEYVALILMATIGLLLLAGTAELLLAFIALELTSLSLYLLTAFRKDRVNSAEAALKYFLFGSVAAAFALFGMSLIFGLSGATNFHSINLAVARNGMSPLLIVALVMVSIGFAFKMAAAPMHLWAPDAYQGAPTPSAAFIASGSKLASFVLFMKFFFIAVPSHSGSASWGAAVPGWAVLICALAATSMILGNLLAIAQLNVRRVIAYSAIAHAGYVLLSLLARSENGAVSAVYYLFTYGLAVIGIFGVIGLVEGEHGEITFKDLRGLYTRAPLISICLLIFVLSLAGIPPLAGFFGKFYVFIAALEVSRVGEIPGLLWIVILAVGSSAVSLYYYLQILKQAFVVEPADSTSDARVIVSPVQKTALALLAAAVLLLGCFPGMLLEPLEMQGGEPDSESFRLQYDTRLISAHVFGDLR